MMHLVSDLTARDLGGYHAVLAVHAEGSIEAEKMQILREHDASGARSYADRLAAGVRPYIGPTRGPAGS